MRYLKLTNISNTLEQGKPLVINIDNLDHISAVGAMGPSFYVYFEGTKYSTTASGFINRLSIGVFNANLDDIKIAIKEINDAITAAPGAKVVKVHTTKQINAFVWGA